MQALPDIQKTQKANPPSQDPSPRSLGRGLPTTFVRGEELVVAPGNPATLRAAANTSQGVVLGRPGTTRYRSSLRPSPARFSPANHDRISRRDH